MGGGQAPRVVEEDEDVALGLDLLQPAVPFGVDCLDDLDRVLHARGAQRAQARTPTTHPLLPHMTQAHAMSLHPP